MEDTSQRSKTDEALGAGRELFESLLENSPAVIYAKRKEGQYIYINREWERVCGLSREQVIGRTDYDLFPPEFAKQFRSNDVAVLQAGGLIEYEERVETPWGEQLFLSKKYPLISASGEVQGLCGISTNITDQRRSELALRDTVTTLERERENKLMSAAPLTQSETARTRSQFPSSQVLQRRLGCGMPCGRCAAGRTSGLSAQSDANDP